MESENEKEYWRDQSETIKAIRSEVTMCCHMLRVTVVFVFTIVLSVCTPAQLFALESQELSDSSRLNSQAGILLQYDQDFIDLSRSQKNRDALEYGIAQSLYSISFSNYHLLDHAGSLMWIYEIKSCEQDKPILRKFIEQLFANFAKSLDISIKAINIELADTHLPGTAMMATRLRDEVRKSKTLLEAIVLR